ncbi:MAG: peptidylprolyl isomerase, partial [Limosilactobacillus sp.]|nr:peptidylprolyl isomerase [Limosilactobacillus sp.]
MKYKKIVTIMAGLALMGPLAACGNRVMATTSGGKITQDQYYKKLKQSSAGQEVMQQMILDQVLEKQYGKQVTDKKVNAQFNSYKDSYGAAFNTMLQQNGMTAQSFK